MMRLECPDGYGWEGEYMDGECHVCEAGHYSASWGPTVRCLPCPPGTYSKDSALSHECIKCPQLTPISEAGSGSRSDCHAMAKTLEGDLTATVEVTISASGDYTFLNDMLSELSGYEAHEMSAQVEYDGGEDVSEGKVHFVMSEKAAYDVHMYVQEMKTLLPLANDWIATGHSYVNRIFSMLNIADSLYLLNLDMDPSEIHKKMRHLRINDIDSTYHQNCLVDQMHSDEPDMANMFFCKQNDDYDAATINQMYLTYTAQSEACSTLGGRDRLARYIKHDWEVSECQEPICERSLIRCDYDDENKECWIVVYAKSIRKFKSETFDSVKLVDENDVEFTKAKEFEVDSCPGGPMKKDVEDCDEACGKEETVSWRTGRCESCPFGAMWSESNEKCSTSEQVMGSFNCEGYQQGTGCIQSGDHVVDDRNFLLGYKPFNIPRDNRHHHKMNIEGKLDVCFVVHQRNKFSGFCENEYENLDDLSFDDLTGFDLTKMACLVMDRIDDIYESNCGSREYSWPNTDRIGVDWLDAACMVVKHVQLTMENLPDGDHSKCEEVNEEHRILTMPFNFGEGFTNDLNWGSILIPLLSHVDSMTHADFSTVTTALEGAMKRLGLFETETVTGLKMSIYLRDLIIHLPENIKMSTASYELMNQNSDVYCDNGNVKMDCQNACDLPYNFCLKEDGDDKELTCHADECDNCAVSYTYYSDSEKTDKPYVCLDVESCELISGDYDKAILALIDADPKNDGNKLFHFQCESGFRLNGEADSDTDCKGEEWKGFGCGKGNSAIESPECIEDKCEVPEGIENGFVQHFHGDARHTCRYAVMACNPGYRLEGDPICYCDLEGRWPTEMPKCVPAECEGSDTTIENGQLINHLVGTDEAWYRCDVNNPAYNGDRDYFSANFCDETLLCSEHEADNCPPTIENGYKVREWEDKPEDSGDGETEVAMEDRVWMAEYHCNSGYDIEDNDYFAGKPDKHGWAKCEYKMDYLPTCVPVESQEPGPCKMPATIPNGVLSEEFKDDKDRVSHGKYECNVGYMMIETVYGDMGFCRNDYDRSYELPQCVSPDDFMVVEFELVDHYGKKMDNAGRVKARYVYADGTNDGWFMGCDDHFNHPAAAAICHGLGFKDGKMIDAVRKMKPVTDIPFGVTNFYCMYNDLLATSKDCHTDYYGAEGLPICTPEEQIAVSCYDETWNVDVQFHMKSRRKHKMFCPVTVTKEGISLNVKKMGMHASWGGLNINEETGEYEYTAFEEGTHIESRGYRKKQGFRAMFIGNADDYDCFYCNLHLGEHFLDSHSENNHNCGQ